MVGALPWRMGSWRTVLHLHALPRQMGGWEKWCLWGVGAFALLPLLMTHPLPRRRLPKEGSGGGWLVALTLFPTGFLSVVLQYTHTVPTAPLAPLGQGAYCAVLTTTPLRTPHIYSSVCSGWGHCLCP